MFQLGEEVSRRLDAVDMRGRTLTLKIMKRDPDAPVEPPKVDYTNIHWVLYISNWERVVSRSWLLPDF